MNKAPFQSKDVSFSHVADMFLSELRNGVTLSIDLLVRTFPHLEGEIRTQLPTLALLEQSVGVGAPRHKIAYNEVIGGCRIVRELGRGAMGVVYEANQCDINRTVAIKLIPMTAANRGSIERFELEANAMGRLEHPNITPVYAFGHDKNYAFLVMRLIDGHSLYDLQNGAGNHHFKFLFQNLHNEWNALAELGIQAASALHHAHERKLIHRDVKPGNLLLDRNNKVWITDFGLAKLYDQTLSLSLTGDAVGTPRYMAPEQVRGVSDARSDVYSLGVTLYELAAGKQVWEDKSAMSLISQKSQLELTPLDEIREDVPPNLLKILAKACQFDPANRYQSAKELEIVLRRFLDGCQNSDRRKGKRLPDDEFHRRSRKRIIVSGIVGSAACLSIGAWLALPPTESSPVSTVVVTSTETNESAVRLMDKLADDDSDDMLEIVTSYVSDSITETSEKLNYSESAKNEIQNQVQNFTSKVKEQGGISKESLNEFLKSYRNTSLPAATRVMRLNMTIQSSALSAIEKVHATQLVRLLSAAVANDRISENECTAIVIALLGQPDTSDQIASKFVETTHFRNWIKNLEYRLMQLPRDAFDVRTIFDDKLKSAVDRALQH